MSRLAQECGAINLSQGFPDFDPPQRLVELVTQKMREGVNQYAPMAGWPPLLQAIAEKVESLYRRRVAPETEVTVTSGATEALFCAIHAVVRPGDEVILLEPAYDSYEPAVELAGGRVVRVPLQRPQLRRRLATRARRDDFADAAADRQLAAQPDGRGVLGCRPRRTRRRAARQLGAGPVRRGLRAHRVRRAASTRACSARPELAERSFVGLVVRQDVPLHGLEDRLLRGAPGLDDRVPQGAPVRPVCRRDPDAGRTGGVSRGVPGHALGLAAFYERKRDHFCRLLERTPLAFVPAAGTYFQLADYSRVSDLPDVEFARWLTREVGVAAIPVSVFSASPSSERLVRFCFAKSEATLDAAGERLSGLQASGGVR